MMQDQALQGASVGIHVEELPSGRILLSQDAGQLLAPASTLKTVTTATALEVLGPDFRFMTVYGTSGIIDRTSGVLEGSLVVRGGGDPTLGSAAFDDSPAPQAIAARMGERLKAAGIDRVNGDLIIDLSAFGVEETPGGWAWEDIGNYYGAGPSGLTFADNRVTLFFDSPARAGEPVTLVRCEPRIPWLRWQNELRSSSVNRDLAYVYGSPWGERRLIRGTIPAARRDFAVKAAMPDPPRWFGNFLISHLTTMGIGVTGKVTTTRIPAEMTPLDTLYSPPLSRIIREINHESINLFAEHLVIALSQMKSPQGNLQEGLQVIANHWKERGVRDLPFLEDGSGLSRANAVTPRFLTGVLRQAYKSPHAVTFLMSLPSAGNGTLSGFSTGDFPGETLRCKSGSMERVRGYAGYLKCDSGREVAFALLVNNFPGSSQEVVKKIRELLTEIRKKY